MLISLEELCVPSKKKLKMSLFENLGLLASRMGFSRKNVIFVKFRETVEPRNGAKFRVLQRHFYEFEGHTLIRLRSYISWI